MLYTRARFLSCRSAILIVVIGCIALISLTGISRHGAEARQVSAVELKAAFIINFLRFAEWPPERTPAADQLYVIAVLSDRELQRAVEAAAGGQTVDGRKIAVRGVSSVDDAGETHLVFIGASEERRVASLVRQLSGWPVLTVGDTPGFGQAGVMLNLFLADQRLQFEANTAAASRAGVSLRASLLRLARIVG